VSENEELDPEIADLLGINSEIEDEETQIEKEESISRPLPKTELRPVNLAKVLKDKNHYQKIISMSGECGKRFHSILQNFSKAEDKDEKSMYREKLIPAYWNMLASLVDNFFEKLSNEKQVLYRYGLLNTIFIDENQKEILFKINRGEGVSDEIYFLDEWLLMVGNGKIRQSAFDETIKARKKSPSALKSKMERKIGSKEAELVNLRQKIEQHLMIEKSLKSSTSIILNHETSPEYGEFITPYNHEQKKALLQIQDIVKSLLKSDRDIENAYRVLRSLDEEIETLGNIGGDLLPKVDTKTIKEEFISLRQMIKLTVGKQGNHFPFLVKSYMPSIPNEVCSKENLKKTIQEIEAIDPGVFLRRYKQEEHRIVPYFIIVPSYGDYGICWEPFEKVNKATSKGRIAVPMFPRNLKAALLYALGDLRWQIAKEKALHYWMEEGLTGNYYDYIQTNKIKGDLKESFIQDYMLWINFESQGMQKLHKDVRAMFWRYIPFPQDIKEQLKNRGYYYSDLYKKDQNRAISRGY